VRIEPDKSQSRRALTILEMLVSVTLLLFIVVGLTAMFVQTQRAFQAGVKQSGVSDVGSTVVDMIASDLAQLSDAKNPNITNLFWGWNSVNYTYQYENSPTIPFRTNQAQEVFMLVRTNGQWEGIGYAVSNTVTGGAGAGTLYRYEAQTSAPLVDNGLFTNFINAVGNQSFIGPNFHRVADGVIHLKIFAFDQSGNEDAAEYFYGDYNPGNGAFSYPLPYIGTNAVLASTNDLPGSLQLEVGVLEPDTYAQARALSGITGAETNFLSKAAGNVHVFRQQIPIAGVVR